MPRDRRHAGGPRGLLPRSRRRLPAADATVKGTFAGPGLPDAGEGVTSVRAVNAATGVVGGTDYTSGKRDRWRLVVAPGPYALAAATVPFGGGKQVDRLARVFPTAICIAIGVGGLIGFNALLSPFAIPLAVAVGWLGVWMIRSDAVSERSTAPAPPVRESAPEPTIY